MPIPETLCHPFTTAKIVIRPAACSVGNGLIVAARRRYAALCACGRRGERTENRCDREKGSKCLPHSRPSCACIVRLGTAAPSCQELSPLQVTPSGPLYLVNLVH